MRTSLAFEVGPNPFVGPATLRYRLPEAMHVRLAVYDVSGRQVARLVDGVQGPGAQEVVLDGGRLPSGAYRCRLEAAGVSLERVVVRLR